MARRESLPPLTPRAREVVTLIVNAVALGSHDDDAEIGAVARALKTTPVRLLTIARKLQEQGWLTINGDFLYPTAAALRWQNPDLSEAEAKKVLKQLK
jgi:hypothetical protein